MRFSAFGISVFATALALAFVAGCNGANVTGSLPQGTTQARKASGSSGALLYVTTNKAVVMVSYPQGKIVGTISWYIPNDYICSDPTNGNVFIPEGFGASDSTIYEYAHGATTPTTTLSLPSGYYEPIGCAVDPTTGNLAVAVNYGPSNIGALLVYANAQGIATPYSDKQISRFWYPAYDDSGNLYIRTNDKEGGIRIAELAAGENTFKLIKFANCTCAPAKLQYDGTYLTAEDDTSSGRGAVLDQFSISGTSATLVATVELPGATTRNLDAFWIHGGSVFAALSKIRKNNNQGIGVWPYPSGGNPTAKIYGLTKGKKDNLVDMTISVVPSR